MVDLLLNKLIIGAWPSGKALDSGSRDRRFESYRPSHEFEVHFMWTPHSLFEDGGFEPSSEAEGSVERVHAQKKPLRA